MNRRGKIATLGIMIFYLLASMWGLYVVYTEFFGEGVEAEAGFAVGNYQGALLAAYGRADEKKYYLNHAAHLAVDEAAAALYEDTLSLLDPGNGDMERSCQAYAYPFLTRCFTPHDIPVLFAEDVRERTTAYAQANNINVPYVVTAQPGVTELRSEPLTEEVLFNLGDLDASIVSERLAGSGNVHELSWPSSSSQTITSCFGYRPGVSQASSDYHTGLDIGPEGYALAPADGIVMNDIQIPENKAGTLWIKHSDQLSTGFLHLDKSTVTLRPGDVVKRSQRLGVPSNTGTKEKHLHFEVLVKDAGGSSHVYNRRYAPGWLAVNPTCFLNGLDDSQISPNAKQSCLRPDYPKPPLEAYCNEYGFTLTDAKSYQQGISLGNDGEGVETTESPAAGEEAVQPVTAGLTLDEQQKFERTDINRRKYGWDEYVIAASTKYGIDQALILGIITQESLGDPLDISYSGSAGVMQISYGTGLNLPGLGESHMTDCGCQGPGPNCLCTVENDYRLRPDVAIDAGTALLKEELQRFSHYTDTDYLSFAIAAYNMGSPSLINAINAVGSDPTWEEVAKYLDDHGKNRVQVGQVLAYVPAVHKYIKAWNGGESLAARPGFSEVKGVKRLGIYSYTVDVRVEGEDVLTPFQDLYEKINEVVELCKKTDNPSSCLQDQATLNHWESSCEEQPAQYFVNLYEALADCARNEQYACQCALPVPVEVNSEYYFTIDENRDVASPFPRLSFMNISEKSLRVDDFMTDLVDITLNEEGLKLRYERELGEESKRESVEWNPGWVVEKNGPFLTFREDASGVPQCAPVKTQYPFCTELIPGLPKARFALELVDEQPPSPPVGLVFDGTNVVFSPSFSEDVSFYNVYNESSLEVPVLQVRGESFDGRPYLGMTLYVTAVDTAGNEGADASVLVH